MTELARTLTATAWAALGGEVSTLDGLSLTGSGDLPSVFAVTDLAAASVAVAALAVAELVGEGGAPTPAVEVDRRLASFWFAGSLRPQGWTQPPPWDPIAGDYQGRDGWIRLHTNAPRHRAAAQRVLGPHADKAAMSGAVAQWSVRELETAVVAAGGCAAEMRDLAAWADHPQGAAVAREPLVHREPGDPGPVRAWTPSPSRPLSGIRVLDLTRVLAGPVGSRFLAGYGADVLRIDPPDWDEPGVIPEVSLGKRSARLDLKIPADRAVFEGLLAGADVMVHGYRPEALERLGYGDAARFALSPGLIDVSLCAYGWTGPWAGRRGFDSLMQMSAGIADAGMRWKRAERPTPLPVQALDFATGYLMAAAAVRGLTERVKTGRGGRARLSLARTARLLVDAGRGHAFEALAAETEDDLWQATEPTDWGAARRVKSPHVVAGAPAAWDWPARRLGWSAPRW